MNSAFSSYFFFTKCKPRCNTRLNLKKAAVYTVSFFKSIFAKTFTSDMNVTTHIISDSIFVDIALLPTQKKSPRFYLHKLFYALQMFYGDQKNAFANHTTFHLTHLAGKYDLNYTNSFSSESRLLTNSYTELLLAVYLLETSTFVQTETWTTTVPWPVCKQYW